MQSKDRKEFYIRYGVSDDWDFSLYQKTPNGWKGVSDEVWNWHNTKMKELEQKVKIDTIKRCITVINTHYEHEGGYCDTGEDVEWDCRSKCVELATKRLDKVIDQLSTSPEERKEKK